MAIRIARLPLKSLLSRTFSALQYRNYRLWFSGQLISLFGTWMQSTAQGFLVYQLTGSPAYLGYVGFAAGVPSWLFMLYGGVVADRISKRRLLLITQTVMMILAIILSALTFTHLVQPWHIIVLAFCLGTANAFDAPARLAFVSDLVPREQMTNAIALNATMFNAGTVLGPALAGITYAAFGPQWCFAINALSFLAVIVGLALMQLEPASRQVQATSAVRQVREGLDYVFHHPSIRIIILNLAMISLFGLGFITLMPAWSVEVLGGNATTNGYLQSARGVGALIGALMIASLGNIRSKGKVLTLGSFAFPLFLLAFSLMRQLPPALLAICGAGWSFMILMNMSNALVQTQVDDALRGRVMGIYTLTFFGLMPLGSLLNGSLGAQIGEPLTVQINALIMLAAAALLYLRAPRLRQME